MRNVLIGVGVGAAISLVTDQTLGAYLRNESNPASARPLIWTLPMAFCGGIGAAFPSYPVIYRK
jgi:predicted lysophospholipase L1 biosynthesis ABC-type transport system permease subunit